MNIVAARTEGACGGGVEMATVETMPALRRYMQTMLACGASMRLALVTYRGAGGKIRTDDFAVLWRDERRKRDEASR